MRNTIGRGLIVVASLLVIGAGTEEAEARYSRRTPIVEAVAKTREGILTVHSFVQTNWGKKKVVGTAVIVDERGIAITNAHVVADSTNPTLVMHDGTKLVSSILIEDEQNDLAILSLPVGRKYKELTFASGRDLLVGEDVISVGNPYGYTNTVSTGIISALDRKIDMPSGITLRDLIQTNASINPGNSGGPLLNINGELIGINVAVREDAQGIAFALNVDTVKRVLLKHLSASKVSNIRHGLICREMVQSDEDNYVHQLIVDKITETSPASKVLEQDDVIVKVNARKVTNCFDLERALWHHDRAKPVQASILRDGKIKLVSLTFDAAKPVAKAPQPKPQRVVAQPQPVYTNSSPVTNYSYPIPQPIYPYQR